MEPIKQIKVEVAYAMPGLQHIVSIDVKQGALIQEVIDSSGILELFPEIDLAQQAVGIFGKMKKLTDCVQAGDRVEIYRPLLIDPKEARRARGYK